VSDDAYSAALNLVKDHTLLEADSVLRALVAEIERLRKGRGGKSQERWMIDVTLTSTDGHEQRPAREQDEDSGAMGVDEHARLVGAGWKRLRGICSTRRTREECPGRARVGATRRPPARTAPS